MKCPDCQSENPENSRFCLECGQRMELRCLECGTVLPLGAKFCNECGHSVAEAAPQDATTLTLPTESAPIPTPFADNRYRIKDLLGEGGKKKVCLAHDTLLDRDVAFALIEDHTRLTQSEHMLGTVAYLPPEQAAGGDITVQANLYSLGAMVYEIVTGHRPFVGNDSVAIIGAIIEQDLIDNINTCT